MTLNGKSASSIDFIEGSLETLSIRFYMLQIGRKVKIAKKSRKQL